ncbi:MAG TPA: carbohydrate ABC transporter permease [Anaerolineaceae bacterium]|nr:carbohydrate ABC transporter permease [Anaerolineaceae bacterium]HQH84401.1 carbohydrate ABC transporter permease [Anaerolineaceae bacterium]
MDNPTHLPVSSETRKKDNAFKLRRILSRSFLYLILIFGALVAFLPFFWMTSTSLMTLGETINRKWLPAAPQFQNYIDAWEQAKFAKYFLNSVIITVTTVVGLVVTSTLAGYAFGRIKFWGRDAIFAILLATMMIPETVTLLPNLLMIRGAILPLPGGSWLNTLQALTVPFMANAFSIFLLKQFFSQVPNELYDAARIDGAGHFRFLMQIVLPISKAPMMTVVLFGFIGAWNAFAWPLLVTTRETWRPLMVGLWTFVTEAGPETHLLMAGAVISLLPILVVYFFTQKQFTEGIATTGLKG